MPNNASIAIELQTTGSAQVLRDLHAVEQATQRMGKGISSKPIDLGLKKQMEEANREALKFQQMNRGLAAQVIGRTVMSQTLSTAMQGSQLAEPIKRAVELLSDIGLQMLAIAGTMKAIETTRGVTGGLTGGTANVASNIAGGALIGSAIGRSPIAAVEKQLAVQKLDRAALLSAAMPQIIALSKGQVFTGSEEQIGGPVRPKKFPQDELKYSASRANLPTSMNVASGVLEKKPSILSTPIPGTGGMVGAAGGIGAIIAVSLALESVIKEFTELGKEVKIANDEIDKSGLGIEKIGATWLEVLKQWSSVFNFGSPTPTMDQYDDKAITSEQQSAFNKLRIQDQITASLEKAGRELVVLSDGSKQWVKNVEEFNRAEVALAVDRKDFQANDFEATKRLTEATTESYNRQLALINASKQLQEIRRNSDNYEMLQLNQINQKKLNASLTSDSLMLNNSYLNILRKESMAIQQLITDREREVFAIEKQKTENEDFMNQLYGKRGYAGEQAKSVERSKALGEKNLIPQFEAVFQRLLKDTSSVMSTAEKSALAWDGVMKTQKRIAERGNMSEDLLRRTRELGGYKPSAVASWQARLDRNDVLNNPESTPTEKRFARLKYLVDVAEVQKTFLKEKGKIEPFAQRADRGSQEAFKIIAGSKAQDQNSTNLKEIKAINARMLEVLTVNNAFLNKMIIMAQKEGR